VQTLSTGGLTQVKLSSANEPRDWTNASRRARLFFRIHDYLRDRGLRQAAGALEEALMWWLTYRQSGTSEACVRA
jgi:hypothetical protein